MSRRQEAVDHAARKDSRPLFFVPCLNPIPMTPIPHILASLLEIGNWFRPTSCPAGWSRCPTPPSSTIPCSMTHREPLYVI